MSRVSGVRKTTSLGVFLVVSVLAGVLVAGLAVPAAALVGVSSNVVSTTLSEIPQELKAPPMPLPTRIQLADSTHVVDLYDQYRHSVKLDEIAPVMRMAQVAIEDDRFYEHGALDFRALVKAATTYVVSDDGGGGSTLTQQYVKQVMIQKAEMDTTLTSEERQAAIDAAQARSISRKISEMRMAIAVENELTKDQILENYLNIAYYGDHTYGVEAAARHYFGVTAAELNLSQAAMLAGLVQTPSRNPVLEPDGAMERRNTVLDRMLELGLVSEEEVEAAKAEGFDKTKIQHHYSGCANASEEAFIQVCQYIVNTLQDNERLGASKKERLENLKRGGYTITATIDPVKQRAAQQ